MNHIAMIKQALSVNRRPFPWGKAFLAGMAASLPVVIGLLLGHFEYGIIAGLGGFSFLYVFDIPYAKRAKKIFFVVLGITLAAFLGTIAAPYPHLIVIFMGLIAGIAVYVFGAFQITGPSAIFFVLVFSMVSGMPVNPDEAFLRAGLVFLGGCLSWILGMIGWFFNPHGPEQTVVKRLYMQLATFLDSVGTDRYEDVKQRMVEMLNEASNTIKEAHIPWRESDQYKRLYILTDQASEIVMYVTDHFSEAKEPLPKELGQMVRELAQTFDIRKNKLPNAIIHPDNNDKRIDELFYKIYDADATRSEPEVNIDRAIRMQKLPLQTTLSSAFNKDSIVFISALRFTFVTTLAAFIAFFFEFDRSYWVPLSCVAVMSGATIIATYNRAIQRGIGTVIGIIIASLILAVEPSGFLIALFILVLTFITELFIVKNYGLAAMFFTPNALIMAVSTSTANESIGFFAQARIIDVLIGSAIGLLGVWLLGRKSASSRLPHLVSKTIRSQAQLLIVLFSDQGKGFNPLKSEELKKVRINLANLKLVYNTATGEIPVDRKSLDYYWQVVFTILHIGHLLEETAKMTNRPKLSDQTLSQLLYSSEMMATAANIKRSPAIKDIPEINGFPSITKELRNLQNVMQTKKEASGSLL